MNTFLQEIELESADFTNAEENAWETLSEHPLTKSIRLVEVGDLSSYLSGDELALSVPGNDDTLHCRGLYLQQSGDTSYTWWGELAGAEGYVGMAANSAGRLLYVNYPAGRYILAPAGFPFSPILPRTA